jgi:hypothetical protein
MDLSSNNFFLEGIRVATGNNPFTYPPRDAINDQAYLNSSPGRAEYAIWVSGQSDAIGIEIGDSNLIFCWTRNNSTITRFDWDGFNRRWMTLPGSGPSQIGTFGNSPRVIAAPPDPIVSFTECPYSIYLGSPTRVVTFAVSLVSTSSDFGNPSPGTVEVSRDKGELNWGTVDLANSLYKNQLVYFARQSFLDRQQNKGQVGQFPESTGNSYSLFLNPIPGPGQTPRVRIGYGKYLTAIAVVDEAHLGSPSPGTFTFSLDTGRLRFAPQDVAAHLNKFVYYDGVIIGKFSLVRGTVGIISNVWPASVGTASFSIGLTDTTRYVWFIEPTGKPRYYYSVVLGNGTPTAPPADGSIYINTVNGKVYSAPGEASRTSAVLTYVDTIHEIERGISVQFYRSAVNVSGPAVAPDFKEIWYVQNQVIVDGISSSPFAMMPTVPIVDSALSYKIDPGTGGGFFTGDLVSSIDPSKPGVGYLLDLDAHQFKFYSRKTISKQLPRPSPSLKLDDAAITTFGFEATRNNIAIIPNTDFDFDPNAGVVEFTEPVGENDPRNIPGIGGTITLPNHFTVQSGDVSSSSQGGKYLIISSGPNAGVYVIHANVGQLIIINGSFKQNGNAVADIRETVDIVVDRVWKPFAPSIKKLQINKGSSINGPFNLLGQDDFTVLATNGQVNLALPTKPDDVFKIQYTSLDSDDYGVTVISTAHEEFAGFKIRQEMATYTPGSGVIHFNPDGKTVLTDFTMSVYIDGVTQEPGNFTFTAPGTISVSFALSTQQVVIDYYVAESPGGNSVFNLLHTPIDIDFPTITAGSNATQFSGDHSYLTSGSPILIDNKDVVLVGSATYDHVTDMTNIVFNPTPSAGTTTTSQLQVTDSITGSYLTTESLRVDTVPIGSNTLTVFGNAPYPSGTIVLMDNDPYLVVSSTLKSGVTKVVFATGAYRNYILPVVRKTIRPILEPITQVKTSKPVHTGFQIFLYKFSDSILSPLVQGVDYNVADGGTIDLEVSIKYGDIIYACYVARVSQPAGTLFRFNYALQIAPDQTNGLVGQKLVSSYNLYNPDTFYYRIESVATFIPEIIDSMKQSSSTSSGPNTSSVSSLKNKDYGNTSLYFDEQHSRNFDIVTALLLKTYNDQANIYEDILANFDGRVVGGTSGRFRFNGDTSGVIRADYNSVQNDIDDQIKLYDQYNLISFFPFRWSVVPVYGAMWDYGPLSRFYGTYQRKTVVLNDQVAVAQFGSVIGNIGVTNITFAGTFFTTQAKAKFKSVSATGKVLTMLGTNGSASKLLMPFVPGLHVKIFRHDGTQVIFTDIHGARVYTTVDSVSPEVLIGGETTYNITLADAINFQYGAVVSYVHVPPTPPTPETHINFYRNGVQVLVNTENGDVINYSDDNNPITGGSELVDIDVGYLNGDTTPRRIPALDGLEVTDNSLDKTIVGNLPNFDNPPLTYENELRLFDLEEVILYGVGQGTLAPDPVIIPPPIPPQDFNVTGTMTGVTMVVNVGNVIRLLNGPFQGAAVTVTTTSPGAFTFMPKLPITDIGIPRDMYIVNNPSGDLLNILGQEIGVLSSYTALAPSGGAKIGRLNSEMISAINAAAALGPEIMAGHGTVSGDTLTGSGFDLVSPPITNSCYILIRTGNNTGLYKVKTVAPSAITLDTTSPFGPFPSVEVVNYSIIRPWSFVTSKQPIFLVDFIRRTLAFIASTNAWIGSVTYGGVTDRAASIEARKADVATFIGQVTPILTSDIYNPRYAWIQKRIDRETGYLVKIKQAAQQREKAQAKLISDQQTLLVVSQLTF